MIESTILAKFLNNFRNVHTICMPNQSSLFSSSIIMCMNFISILPFGLYSFDPYQLRNAALMRKNRVTTTTLQGKWTNKKKNNKRKETTARNCILSHSLPSCRKNVVQSECVSVNTLFSSTLFYSLAWPLLPYAR